MERDPLTPCIICEKAVIYEFDNIYSSNLNSGSWLDIESGYGSVFDNNIYRAIICDECLDKVIQSKRVRFLREVEWRTNDE